MFNKKYPWVLFVVVGLLGACTHKTTVKPSHGHIDSPTSTRANAPVAQQAAEIPKPIKPAVKLPPPSPKPKAQTYSVVVNEVPVKEILFALARESRLNIDIHPSIQGRVTLNAVDQTLPAILERLAKQVDLTYRMDGDVLTITPDQPVLRTYKVDYVNMSRDTNGFIGVDGQISTSGQSSGATGSTTTTTGNGANNSSRTSVKSQSSNHFWDNLEKNIKELLAETDKEVIVSRTGTLVAESASGEQTEQSAAVVAEARKVALQERDEARREYKTLFAANVISNREAGVVSVRGTSKQHEKVQEFLDKVLTSAKRQVLIEATIVEVTLSDGFQAGIDWSRLGNRDGSSGFTFQQSLGPSIDATSSGTGFAVGYVNPISSIGKIASAVTLLQQFGDTKVLSSPKLMVLNNQTAVLKVVDNLVYFTIQVQNNLVANAGSSNTVTTTPNTLPVGIVMSVTPQINDSSVVSMNVRPSITRVIDRVQDPNPNLVSTTKVGGVETIQSIKSEIPVIQIREMESMLMVNSGNIAVLGGLMEDTIQKKTDQVPGLAEIPGIGQAFKGRDNSNKKTELVIFLRPTVISNASLESDELQSFKQFLPAQQLQNVLDEANK